MAQWNGRLIALWGVGVLFAPICLMAGVLVDELVGYQGVAPGMPVPLWHTLAIWILMDTSPLAGFLLCVLAVVKSKFALGPKILLSAGSLAAVACVFLLVSLVIGILGIMRNGFAGTQ
jgi:hypothetical protein